MFVTVAHLMLRIGAACLQQALKLANANHNYSK